MPITWNRSRATALVATGLLHGMLALWLLAIRSEPPAWPPADETILWLPPAAALPPPPSPEPMPLAFETLAEMPFLVPTPEPAPPDSAIAHDWHSDALTVARAFGGKPGIREFGSGPGEPRQLKSDRPPPTVFERPLPRVGTTVRTPEGELIYWVSDYCYIPISSQSLAMGDLHAARQGVRRCIIPIGKREPRGDLFDPLTK